MKKIKILLILILLISVIYFTLDRQLYFNGKSDFNFYNLLPLNIQPDFQYDFEGGFALRDHYGFTIVSESNIYEYGNEVIQIAEIIGYGYSGDKLIAKIIDSIGEVYMIEFVKNPIEDSKREILANVYDPKDVSPHEQNNWIQIRGNSYIDRIELIRNYLWFIVTGLIIALVIMVVKSQTTANQSKNQMPVKPF